MRHPEKKNVVFEKAGLCIVWLSENAQPLISVHQNLSPHQVWGNLAEEDHQMSLPLESTTLFDCFPTLKGKQGLRCHSHQMTGL